MGCMNSIANVISLSPYHINNKYKLQPSDKLVAGLGDILLRRILNLTHCGIVVEAGPHWKIFQLGTDNDGEMRCRFIE